MIYLDNAATTFPKPEAVYREADRASRFRCGNPGRSSHKLSRDAAEIIYGCREELASLFGGEAENVVLTLNATYALNLAINSLYDGGDILISNMEHNAVLRPVNKITRGKFSVFDARGSVTEVISSFKQALSPRTRLVVCNHVSNLCGITLPIKEIGQICNYRGIKFIVDISQSAGIRNVNIEDIRADAICAPGHKGLYGLQGSGFTLFSRKYQNNAGLLHTFVSGGNGVNSLDKNMPDFLPERFEAGTLPTPAAAALTAGIREIKKIGIQIIENHENRLSQILKEALSSVRGVTLYAPSESGAVVLFNLEGIPSEKVGELLDNKGICVRSGFHCCPLGHNALCTGDNGAVRVSFSMFNNEHDVMELCRAIRSAQGAF